MKNYDMQYGNLLSYKYYTRPEAFELYGSFSKCKSQHQQNMQEILQIMFENGACTTWDVAKIKLRTRDVSLIRSKEKVYRRLFLGRYDTKKRSGGMLDLGLVVREKAGPYSKYRLSIHGILYCIDVLNPTSDVFDAMVEKYSHILPKVFGKWKEIKSIAGQDVYKIRILAKGLFLNNVSPNRIQSNTPLYEIMSFIHIKYAKRFESISETELAEQVSYWFFTFLQYYESSTHSRRSRTRMEKIKKMLQQDPDLSAWYQEFFIQAMNYYKERLDAMTNSNEWVL